MRPNALSLARSVAFTPCRRCEEEVKMEVWMGGDGEEEEEEEEEKKTNVSPG